MQFLFGRLRPKPTIVQIIDGVAKSQEQGASWIGDSQAFSFFQQQFHIPLKDRVKNTVEPEIHVLRLPQGIHSTDSELFSKMFDSMQATIDSGKYETVGGFITAVYPENRHLNFTSYLPLSRRQLDLRELGEDGAMPFGDASTGTFSVNCVGFGPSGFAIHISQGRIGIIFRPKYTLVLEPNVFSGKDECEFDALLKSEFGSGLHIHIEKRKAV